MTTRKRLSGALADWHPHPKDGHSLVPVVREAGVADDLADRFFESAAELHAPEPPVLAEPSPRRVAIDSAAVRARRRYLTRYVAGAVSVAGIIGLAAIVRMTTARDANAAASPWRGTFALAASLPASPAEQAAPDTPVATPAPSVADPSVAAAAPGANDPTAGSGATGDAPLAQDPAGAPADEPAPEIAAQASLSAADAKRDAQRAIDRGLIADAIEAGEQSVALDPTDADAWLVLGAAYQMKGRYADARHCFASCADQARRGPRWECRALLR
jgi:tetratricopeptide (TPR) repeat protein